MGAAAIQKKLDNASKKVALKLGYDYQVFRPTNNINPTDTENWVANVKASFTLDDKYSKAMQWGVPIWTTYTQNTEIIQGDFLVNVDRDRTFIVMSKKPHLPVLAIETNDLFNILEVTYTNQGDGWSPENETFFAKNIPCYVKMSSSTINGLIPANTIAKAGVRNVEIYSSINEPAILVGKTLTIPQHGFIGTIISYNISPLGYGVMLSAMEMQTQ